MTYVYYFFILSQCKLYFCFVCMYIYDCALTALCTILSLMPATSCPKAIGGVC